MIMQTLLAVTSLLAIWFSQQSNGKLHKFAPVLGLVSQPFWFYETYVANQWGMFILCFGYTIVWFIGFRRYWL